MRRSALIALAASLSVAACSSAPERTVPAAPATDPAPSVGTAQQAVANLASASGSLVSGKVTLTPMGNGVHITGEVGGLPPNSQHGFHVHEKGDCSAADASSSRRALQSLQHRARQGRLRPAPHAATWTTSCPTRRAWRRSMRMRSASPSAAARPTTSPGAA